MSFTVLTLLSLIGLIFGIYYFINMRPGSKSSLRESYSEGLDLLVSGQRKEAYQHFKSIVQHDSNNIKAYIKLGQVLRESGNPSQALKIHKNLKIRSKITTFEKIELHKNLSLNFIALNKVDEAIDEVKKILSINPSNEWALTNLINCYKKKEDWERASNYLIQYHKISQTQDSHLVGLYKIQEGRIALKNKNFEKAREYFHQSLEIFPNLSSAYLFLGNTYAEESEVSYKKAMELDDKEFQTPNEKEDYSDSVDKAKKQLAQAIPMWTKFTEKNSDQSWLVLPKIKDALFALNRFNEIEEVLKEILSKNPDNVNVLSSLADFYNQKGAHEDAIAIIESAIEKEPNSLIANIIRLKLSSYKNNIAEVRNDCDSLIELFMKDVYHFSNSHLVKDDINWLEKNSPKGTSIKF